jgi:hypothetical protein
MPLEAGNTQPRSPVEVIISIRNDLMSTSKNRQAYREELREKMRGGLLEALSACLAGQRNNNNSDGVFADFVGSPRSRFDAPIWQSV